MRKRFCPGFLCHRKALGLCKAGSRKRFRLVFYRREIPHTTTARCPSRAAPQPTRLRSVARTARTRPALRGERHSRPCPPLRLCMLRGSVQPAPPACRSRLRPAGCAVLPSQRSHTRATPSVPRGAAHTQPPLWAWPAKRLTRAGLVGSSRRRALRYGGWAATFSRTFAGGGGVWDPLASPTEGPASAPC